jgi:16S rRNA (uracil1498-N3)-methyltransferase
MCSRIVAVISRRSHSWNSANLPDVFVHTPELLATGTALELSYEESQHLKARRLRVGDAVAIFTGSGALGRGQLLREVTRRGNAVVRIVAATFVPPLGHNSASHVTAAVAMPKGASRADWLIEKLTELGVQRIIPLHCERSIGEPDETRQEQRWARLVLAACKQSLRIHAPEITRVHSCGELASSRAGESIACLVACPDGDPFLRVSLATSFAALPVLYCVGPEGGFTQKESAALLSIGHASAVSLGQARLRTETAAVALAAALMLQKGKAPGPDPDAVADLAPLSVS